MKKAISIILILILSISSVSLAKPSKKLICKAWTMKLADGTTYIGRDCFYK